MIHTSDKYFTSLVNINQSMSMSSKVIEAHLRLITTNGSCSWKKRFRRNHVLQLDIDYSYKTVIIFNKLESIEIPTGQKKIVSKEWLKKWNGTSPTRIQSSQTNLSKITKQNSQIDQTDLNLHETLWFWKLTGITVASIEANKIWKYCRYFSIVLRSKLQLWNKFFIL